MARQVGPDTAPAEARSATTNPSAVDFVGGITTGKLQLIRSFDIPPGDASHGRLNNLSWTYDNALAAIAFIDAGAKTQAEQLLDQLAALQTSDGGLDFAYNVSSGKGSGETRSGALAWVGIAATYYRRTYASTKYDALIAGVAKYLLDLRQADGLVKGGPDVTWVSTQHNLLTVAFLRDLVSSLASKPASSSLGLSSTTLSNAQNTMSNAILSKFIVQAGPAAYFIEGINDTRIPLDVQSLGAMFLKQRGDGRAAQVGAHLLSNFTAAARTSTALNTNLFGYRPFNAAASRTSSGARARSRPTSRCTGSTAWVCPRSTRISRWPTSRRRRRATPSPRLPPTRTSRPTRHGASTTRGRPRRPPAGS
jgi:hypothetical protein